MIILLLLLGLTLSMCCVCQRFLVIFAEYPRKAPCKTANLFSGKMRWVLARAWNDNDVWSRDSEFKRGGRKSWFRHQDVHPQGQNGKDKDGVGRLGLSLGKQSFVWLQKWNDRNLLCFIFIAPFVFVLMFYVKESFYFAAVLFLHPYAKLNTRHVRLISSHVSLPPPPPHLSRYILSSS